MITLADFLEPIKAADKTLDEDCKGHRMDGMCPEPNMRATVGLGDCNCCDYFASKDNIVVLIEETQLMKMIINLEKEYHYLNIDVQEDFIYACILQENKLKVYGSMLVLCRLSNVCNDAKCLLKNKKYDFWLVVSDLTESNYRVFEYLKSRLLGSLRGSIGKIMMNAVEVIPADELVAKLSGSASTP